ncbi:MAG: DUF1572 family protein [Acidobacteria bacterium]|nr:DUF1572 family protein [Acidobacteriota bacterium]
MTEQVLANARHSLEKHHLPRIQRCFKMLSETEIWWRPNAVSNSVGNLVLHLNGNVRQWIIAGLGSRPFNRERDKEFSESGPISRRRLIAQLNSTVREACRIVRNLTPERLMRQHAIQGFQVSGLTALLHVTEHFAFHTGQIIYVTKQKKRKDLAFTRLPGDKSKKVRSTKLPTL